MSQEGLDSRISVGRGCPRHQGQWKPVHTKEVMSPQQWYLSMAEMVLPWLKWALNIWPGQRLQKWVCIWAPSTAGNMPPSALWGSLLLEPRWRGMFRVKVVSRLVTSRGGAWEEACRAVMWTESLWPVARSATQPSVEQMGALKAFPLWDIPLCSPQGF